jgi:hypothetical protein
MTNVLSKGDQGDNVSALQNLLVDRGYPVDVNSVFDLQTYHAVRAFQSQNLDQHGQPLVIDGVVGPLTWWSLTHPKPIIETPSAIDYRQMPPTGAGGSEAGRAALAAALGELNGGAGEVGGNNSGPWVLKYLNGMAEEGSSWCAGFVSWCFAQNASGTPFAYTLSARDMLSEFKDKGWTHEPNSGYEPLPGDIVVWWREKLTGWKGHVGLVHQSLDGMLYTIEGNKSPQVQGFSYVLSRMEKLLGYGHVPDSV